jgi:HK97 family phage portal protein
MGLWARLTDKFWRPRAADTTLRNPAAWLQSWFGTTTPTVSANEAWRIGAVMNCVALRSRVIASLPCNIYRRLPDGQRERVPWLSPARALSRQPNPWMTPPVFWQAMVTNLDVYGNAYAEIEWDRPGDPSSLAVGLWPIPAAMVDCRRNRDTGTIEYEVAAARVTLPMESVVHLRAFSFDGVTGISKLTAAARAVGLAYSTEEFGANWYTNGGVPSGVLEHPGTLSETAAKRVRDGWYGTHGSLQKSQRLAILEEGMKFAPVTVSPEQAQFLQVRKFSAGQIAALYGVPARLIGAHDGPVGWGSVEQETLDWVKYGLAPDLAAFEAELNLKLLKASDTYYTKFNVDALLRGDAKSRAESLAVQWEHGVITTNEWRALEDLGPVADDNGDKRYVPLNFAPADQADAIRAANGNDAVPEPNTPRR